MTTSKIHRQASRERSVGRVQDSALHAVWRSLRARCESPRNPTYRFYGARGIRVCPRWRTSFDAFVADMGPRPAGASIDRIHPDGDYEPTNCRWATVREQANNRRSTRHLSFDGVTLPFAEMARRYGLTEAVLRARLLRERWPLDEALLVPMSPARKRGRRSGEVRRAFLERKKQPEVNNHGRPNS